MRVPDSHAEMEIALRRLMPVSLGESIQSETDGMLEELCGDSKIVGFDYRRSKRWISIVGVAAAIALAFVLKSNFVEPVENFVASEVGDISAPGFVFLTESDRVEGVTDDGLYVDSGGSAVRKVRFRVIEESQIRDEETGIVVQVNEPREEMYLVPVSTF